MLQFNLISTNFDASREMSTNTQLLTIVDNSLETKSLDQFLVDGEASSRTTTIDHCSVDHEKPSESSVCKCPSIIITEIPSKAPSESLISKRPSINSEMTSETTKDNHLPIHYEDLSGSSVRRRSSNNLSIELGLSDANSMNNSSIPSESFVRINNEWMIKTSRFAHRSIDEISLQSSTRKSSSIDLQGFSDLFTSKCSSVDFQSELKIASRRISSIHSEKISQIEIKDRDAAFLEQMGYSQELKRGFSGLMSFTFCFTVVSVFPSISIGLDFGLATGGSGLLVWSWIVGSVFNILVGLSLSEICSTYPNSGSVYYWTGQLAPKRFAPLAAYICGWCSYFGNVAGTAAFASGFASIVNAAVELGSASGNSSTGINDVPHALVLDSRIQTAIAIGVVVIWTLQNALKIDQQGWLNNLAAFIQTVSTIGIIVTILALAKSRTSAYDVFIETNNSTGFSFVYVCFIGILPTLFSFSGFESAGHLSEETRDADRKAPIAISGTCISAAVIGFVYLLAILFACGNPIDLVNNQTNPSTTVQVFQMSTPFPVALLFIALLIVCLYFAGVSATTVSSRTGYAMARDSLFPCSKYLAMVYNRTQTPLISVILVGVINILLLLLQLFSTTAFAAIVSISTIGFQISYMLPIVFRCTVARNTFRKGKLNLGRFGIPIGIISVIWLFITCVILLFPYNYPVTSENMNWTIVVCAGITIIAGLYWMFSVRQWYTGPPRMIDSNTTTITSTPDRF